MSDLKGKTLFITGASRGIGHAIAMRAARDGANVVIAAKTTEPHPKLPGTIYTAAEDIKAAGGQALACKVDIRFEEEVQAAMESAVETFGGIDVLINNASAINLTGTLQTSMKRFDLMHQINARGSFLCSKLAIPHLLKADNPHILNISPPLSMKAKWFQNHSAYTLAKYSMSVWVLGMSAEFASAGIGINALWPRTAIATAAVRNILGGDAMCNQSRTPEIMADSAHAILCREAGSCTGNFFIDDEVLAEEGVTDLDGYSVVPGSNLIQDFFLD
ncbi:MAG: short chain dehydrogenase [Myxococcales bacterium]|nr:short chain dehydrogenase [Myxococcales bacterium]